jgi:hypothetical protein
MYNSLQLYKPNSIHNTDTLFPKRWELIINGKTKLYGIDKILLIWYTIHITKYKAIPDSSLVLLSV